MDLMKKFLAPPQFRPEMAGECIDRQYRKMRWQVYFGIFIGYAGYYIVRNNFQWRYQDSKNRVPDGRSCHCPSDERHRLRNFKTVYGQRQRQKRCTEIHASRSCVDSHLFGFSYSTDTMDRSRTKRITVALMAAINFLCRMVQRNGMATLQPDHDTLVLRQGTRHLDVMELCSQYRRFPGRPYGLLWSHLVRFMVVWSTL